SSSERGTTGGVGPGIASSFTLEQGGLSVWRHDSPSRSYIKGDLFFRQAVLVVLGVKTDSGAHAIIKETKEFALNILSKGQQAIDSNFFKSHERQGDTIGGEAFEKGPNGAPLLLNTLAWVTCKLVDTIERGDHSIFVGEVTEAGVRQAPTGRADDATLWLKD